jgi:glyoxylase-like metal-dependent hydrolase (beta-lactamase superfamily II)
MASVALIGALAMVLPAGPSLAQGSAPPFDMTQVTANAYSFRFSIHRNMILVTGDGVIVSDPMNPLVAQHMMAAIEKITDQPVKLVIYSHNHWDHIGGAKIFKDRGAKIIQHEAGARDTRPSPSVVPADDTFSGEQHVVTMGGQTVELIYLGRSHGSGMVVMRVPKERILHTIDVVTPGRVAFRSMPDFTPQGWIAALKKMEQLDYDRIIPGHGPASAPKSAVTEQREYVEDLSHAVANAVKTTGDPLAFDRITELVKSDLRPKYGAWAEFDDWMGMNVERITFEQRLGW